MRIWIAFLLCCFIRSASGFENKGVLGLDTLTFDKIVDGFRPVLVKFDKKWMVNQVYNTIAGIVHNDTSSRLLVAQVEINEYGEKDNSQLAERFGINKKDYPAFLLFPERDAAATGPYSADRKHFKHAANEKIEDPDELLRWIHQAARVKVQLPGTLRKLDQLAREFMANEAIRDEVLKEARDAVAAGKWKDDAKAAKAGKAVVDKAEEKERAEYYLALMDKVLAESAGFLSRERDRLQKSKLRTSKNKEKRTRHQVKLNILQSFLDHDV